MKLFGNNKNEMKFTAQSQKLRSQNRKGSTGREDDSDAENKRAISITLPEDYRGRQWAYENDQAVYRAVQLYVSLTNTGLTFRKNPQRDYDDDEEQELKNAIREIEQKKAEQKLEQTITSALENKIIHGFGVARIMQPDSPIDTMPLDVRDCTPILDSATGNLGGEPGRELANDLENQFDYSEVGMIQDSDSIWYTSTGLRNYQDNYYYFAPKELLFFPANDRGRVEGQSPVERVMRDVEIKKSIENVVEMISTRFGPQMFITLGNENVNLFDTEIPDEFFRDEQDDKRTDYEAMQKFKSSVMDDVEENMQGMVDGDQLMNIVEYGVEPEVLNPSASLPPYTAFIRQKETQIINGIIGLGTENRIDINSAEEMERVPKVVKENIKRERREIQQEVHEKWTTPLLKEMGFDSDFIKTQFEDIDVVEEQREAELWETRGRALMNFARGGMTTLPKEMRDNLKFPKDDKINFDRAQGNMPARDPSEEDDSGAGDNTTEASPEPEQEGDGDEGDQSGM